MGEIKWQGPEPRAANTAWHDIGINFSGLWEQMSIHSVQCTNDRPKTNKQNNSIQVQVYEPKCFNCGHLEEHAQGTTYKGVSSLPVPTSIKKMPSQKSISTVCSQRAAGPHELLVLLKNTPIHPQRSVSGPDLVKVYVDYHNWPNFKTLVSMLNSVHSVPQYVSLRWRF